MYKIIDIIEKTVPNKSSQVHVPAKYIGYDCVIMKKTNLIIEGKNITIKDPSKGYKKRIKPSNGVGRIKLPIDYKGEDVFIFIQEFVY